MFIVQSLDPYNLYLLFTDAGKFCYSDVLNPASTNESNKALIKLLTNKDPLKSVKSQTEDLPPKSVKVQDWLLL